MWGPITDRLLDYLDMLLYYYNFTVDESSLAMFFATLLTDDLTKRYVKAAENGDLLIYDEANLRRTEPKEVELICISDEVEIFQDTLWEMYRILNLQIEKEDFWNIDEEWLETIGKCVVELNSKKGVLLTNAYNETQ